MITIKRETAVDFIKTLAIYLLTASMLATAGIYISGRQNAGQAQAPEIPREKMPVFETGGALRAQINEAHAAPAQITVTAGGDSFTAVYGEIVSDVYKNFKEAVLGVFGAGFICAKLEKEEGGKLWRECANEANSVYIKYAGDYLYPVVYTFLDKTWDGRNAADAFTGDLAAVRELFITDKDPIFGAVRDTNGDIAVFTPKNAGAADTVKNGVSAENLTAAVKNIAGLMPCAFLRGEDINAVTGGRVDIKNLILPDSFHIYGSYNAFSPELGFSNPLLGENNLIDTKQGFIGELFGLLSFNAGNSISYPGPGGDGITFEDGKNTVNFYGGGLIVYDGKPSGADIRGVAGGIHLSKFLTGYGGAENYTLYEKIKAASVFVSRIAGELAGNESGPRLKSITSDHDENLKFVFSYYYEGIKIKIDGSDEGIVVEIGKDRITGVRIKAVNISSQNMGMIKNRDPVWELGVIDGMISSGISSGAGLEYDKTRDKFIVNEFELVYNIDYTNGGGIAAAAREIN